MKNEVQKNDDILIREIQFEFDGEMPGGLNGLFADQHGKFYLANSTDCGERIKHGEGYIPFDETGDENFFPISVKKALEWYSAGEAFKFDCSSGNVALLCKAAADKLTKRRKAKVSRRCNKTVAIRLSDTEAKRVKHAAVEMGVTLGEYARQAFQFSLSKSVA